MGKTRDLRVKVKEIKGTCPVYKERDSFTIAEGYKLKTERTLCTHSLTSILPYYIPLSKGVQPGDLGLGEGEEAYVQCLDPCEYTGGGTVVFEVSKG